MAPTWYASWSSAVLRTRDIARKVARAMFWIPQEASWTLAVIQEAVVARHVILATCFISTLWMYVHIYV